MSKPVSDINKIAKIWKIFRDENDFSVVLISASLIESILTDILKAFMVEEIQFTDNNGGKFKARADMAYALGLISEDDRGISLKINEIRNKFAHSWDSLTFDNEIIAKKVDEISNDKFKAEDLNKYSEFSNRDKFMQHAMMLITDLLQREVTALEHKLKKLPHEQSSWSKVIAPSSPKRLIYLP